MAVQETELLNGHSQQHALMHWDLVSIQLLLIIEIILYSTVTVQRQKLEWEAHLLFRAPLTHGHCQRQQSHTLLS